MSDDARILRTHQLDRTTQRLVEALAELEVNALALDAAIQRFEFSYELAWKALKAHLLETGIGTANPREAFSQAYLQGWIDDEETWLAMLADRNRTSHTYEERLAHEIGKRLPRYAEYLGKLSQLLSARLDASQPSVEDGPSSS